TISHVRQHYPAPDIQVIKDAYAFANEIYVGGKTPAGRQFIMHPLGTAKIVAEMGGDEKAVAAAMLHNAWATEVHDAGGMTLTTKKNVEERFGSEITALIDNVLKESALEEKYAKKLSNTLVAKLIMASMKDRRGFLIKLAARLDMLREAGDWGEEERAQIADKSLQVFAPISNRLGIYQIKDEFEDLGFKYSQPEEYNKLAGMMEEVVSRSERHLLEAEDMLQKKLSTAGISAEITHREKAVYSVYMKMKRKNCKFSEIYDLLGIRIITKSVKDCYVVLGLVHAQWEHIKEEFNDYIAKPKQNNYQSIQTTIIGPVETPIEIQIRTGEMHRLAELGFAADWKYGSIVGEDRYEKRLYWLKQLFDWERQAKNPSYGGFEINYKGDIIVALTPEGLPVELPSGATVLDFAYAIHSGLGSRCRGARVNEEMVSLKHALKNLDIVEIIASKNHQANSGWLGIAKTAKARKKIRAALKIKPGTAGETSIGGKVTIDDGNYKVRLARCCNPVPGDEIAGYTSTNRKISVHRKTCKEIEKANGRLCHVEIEWGSGTETDYSANLCVEAKEGFAVVSELLSVFSKQKVQVISGGLQSANNNIAKYLFNIKINNMDELNKIVSMVGKIRGIRKVWRE
ncbi:HD domain-containing protein, partial [Candidatus Micrarchaeota archaeon]|nr:HD domain-containing protein [Candidatus Micrarchaeota archaeon]